MDVITNTIIPEQRCYHQANWTLWSPLKGGRANLKVLKWRNSSFTIHTGMHVKSQHNSCSHREAIKGKKWNKIINGALPKERKDRSLGFYWYGELTWMSCGTGPSMLWQSPGQTAPWKTPCFTSWSGSCLHPPLHITRRGAAPPPNRLRLHSWLVSCFLKGIGALHRLKQIWNLNTVRAEGDGRESSCGAHQTNNVKENVLVELCVRDVCLLH